MNSKPHNAPSTRLRHGTGLPMVLAMLVLVSGCASARSKDTSVPTQGDTTTTPDNTVGGTTADELHRLMEAHQLTELRTTYNGTYGTSLLFHADKVTYYVALFQNKDFWRVIKTDASDEAEGVYRTFAGQTEQLAQVDIDAIRLEAGKQHTAKLLSLNEARLQMLRQDIDRQRRQAQQVAARQEQTRQQAISLTGELLNTNSQLDTVQQSIRALEAQQANPSLPLPEVPAVVQHAPSTDASTTTASAQP